jgi:cytochrome P450
VVTDLVDELAGRDEIEFCEELAVKIPAYIIADQLGMPRADYATFKRWSDAVIRENDPGNTKDQQLEITRTICELQRYILDRAGEYREAPADNMLSDLVRARDTDGRALSDSEIASMVLQILVAGNDTTTSAMSSAMHQLATTPGLEERLRGDPEAIGHFVEEVLRFGAPIQGLWRRVTRDTELGGTKLREGEIVVLRFGAGNHDPAQFPDPGALDPARANARNHLTFGAGPHFCVGNQLARAELRIAFGIFLDRMRNFCLARGEEGVDFIATYVAYGVRRLELAFEPNETV